YFLWGFALSFLEATMSPGRGATGIGTAGRCRGRGGRVETGMVRDGRRTGSTAPRCPVEARRRERIHMSANTEYQELLETARDAARAAAEVHRRHLGRVRVEDWSEKGGFDFVTHVDREAEERILDLVSSRFPDHAFLAEEAETAADQSAGAPPKDPLTAEWLWVVDPLDGTTNYLHGYPMYAASVAVLHRGELVAAAVVSGATGEEWTATRGGGAFKDGAPVRVSGIDRLQLALIGTGFPFKTP